MPTGRKLLALAFAMPLGACWPAAANAQSAVRGESLYRALPGQPGVGSCVSCHGEPINNRNSVLRGAGGASVISRAITNVSAMGYLRQYLIDGDLADISAYLATVVPAGPLDTLPAPWPASDDFGAQQVGTQAAPRTLLIRNLQPREAIAIGAIVSSDVQVFPVQTDCPSSLAPLAQCRVTAWFRPQAEGLRSAEFSILDSGGRILRKGGLAGTGTASQAPALRWVPDVPEVVDLGRIEIGQASSRVLTLSNASASAVTLQRLRVTGPNALRFTLQAACAQTQRIEAGGSCEVTLGFAPTVAEPVEGWIELVSDASNAAVVRVAATGISAVAAALPPAEPTQGEGGGGSMSLGWLGALFAAVLMALRRGR